MRLLSFVTSLLIGAVLASPVLAQIAGACPVPSWKAQAGEIFFTPFYWLCVASAGGFVWSFFYLFGESIIPFLEKVFFKIPFQVWEVIGYAIVAALMGSHWWLPEAGAYWATFVGCLSLAGMIAFSGTIREVDAKPTTFFGTLCIVWAIFAVLSHSSLIGFIAVGAFVAALGFGAGATPFGYWAGYDDEDKMIRTTWASFVALAAYVGLQAFGQQASWFAHAMVFEQGILWWGGIAGYIGLLILSSKWYPGGNYFAMQILTIVLCAAAMIIGHAIGVEYLFKTGLAAGGFYVFAKLCEIPTEGRTAFMTKVFLLSSGGGGLLIFIYMHTETFGPYILFM